jgi:hypothetical protein
MLDAGLSVNQVVASLSIISGVLGGIGIVGWYLKVPDGVMLLGFVIPVGAHVWFEHSGRNHMPRTWRIAGKTNNAFKTPQPLLK